MNSTEVLKLPEYDNPPISEVVCGILFEPLERFLTPYLGLLWEEFRKDYPTCQETAPLLPVIESLDDKSPVETQVSELSLLPRIWFIQRDQTGLIQVQRDRFLYNWRKVSDNDAYPRYGNVIGKFRAHLSQFNDFIRRNELGNVIPLQYELTYINQIQQGGAWEVLSDIGKIFPDFIWRNDVSRFLSPIDGLNWRSSFLLPNRDGRLHITIKDAKRRDTGRIVLILELTVRGITNDTSNESMYAWFDSAREVIVRGFADITSDETQTNIWQRRGQ